jgi:hypothetical protein
VMVTVDAGTAGPTINPEILGVTGSLTADQLQQVGYTVNSWGGNPITRYNYMLGNAWNNGSDYEFRNTSFDFPPGPLAQEFIAGNKAVNVKSRLAIPTLGWVAKNNDINTCGFPQPGGGCANQADAGNCASPKMEADPNRTSVPSSPPQVAAWLEAMAAAGATPDYVAMDNEPDLWGHTHYDVHPDCPTYEEILEKFLAYATMVRETLPGVAITGPVLCCWYDYWRIAPGPADGSGQDFLGWFLDNVKAHDATTGRTLDYLDVHFYPQTDVYNDKDDPTTNARRLRSTRALWDPEYTDESWINTPIEFIPRMKKTIADHYPDTKLFISEWNFGNDKNINGALAIADVLGIFGREGVDAATYYRHPDPGSPGAFAFSMFADYDGKGSRFGGTSVAASSADARVGAYAAVDQGVLRVVLVNRDPAEAFDVNLGVTGFDATGNAKRFQYSPQALDRISADSVPVQDAVRVPPSSITLLEFESAG